MSELRLEGVVQHVPYERVLWEGELGGRPVRLLSQGGIYSRAEWGSSTGEWRGEGSGLVVREVARHLARKLAAAEARLERVLRELDGVEDGR